MVCGYYFMLLNCLKHILRDFNNEWESNRSKFKTGIIVSETIY
jgi:hypothetical protein